MEVLMNIRINLDACTGHGRCYALSQELFGPDDSGMPILQHGAEVPSQFVDAARRAVDACPEYAISVTEDVAS